MIACVVALVLLAVVLGVQAFALHVEIKVLHELRAIVAAVQELRNRKERDR